MDELANTKEEKMDFNYPLVQKCDMTEEMKDVVVEIIVGACEQYGSDYMEVAKSVKLNLDKKYGSHWNAVVGETFAIQITYQNNTLMYMFYGGTHAICAWKA